MSIYTKTGDKGETSLIGGDRVKKCDDRVEAYGTLDELSAFIGVLYDQCAGVENLQNTLIHIQRNLFTIEAVLACSEKRSVVGLREEEIIVLENQINELESKLSLPYKWVIPGGNIASSYCHVCRTVCRRAERKIVKIGVYSLELAYINRLSDYFFVLAEFMNQRE